MVVVHRATPPSCEVRAQRSACEPVRSRRTWLISGGCRPIWLEKQWVCWTDCQGLPQGWVSGVRCTWARRSLETVNRGPLPWQPWKRSGVVFVRLCACVTRPFLCVYFVLCKSPYFRGEMWVGLGLGQSAGSCCSQPACRTEPCIQSGLPLVFDAMSITTLP